MPLNSRWLLQSRKIIAEVIRRNYRALPTNLNGVMIRSAVQVARSLDLESVVSDLNLAEFELPESSYTIQGWYHRIWRAWDDEERFVRPVASVLSAVERDVQITPTGEDRVMVRFPTLAPEFDQGMVGAGPKWVNAVSVKQYTSKPDVAVVLPSAGFETRRHYPTVGAGDQFV